MKESENRDDKERSKKVMWVGRTTAFLVGLAVIVGLTVGLSSAVFAQARPGGQPFFRLGEINTANALSGLVGSVAADAMLLIDNNGGGPALDLKVEPGQAPMKVDSSARVANLNADQLDGKSEEDFYAAGSKVEDSDKLDGQDSSAFQGKYVSTVVVSPVGTPAENGTALLDALSGIRDASQDKPYLLYIEAGTYDLGSGFLAMKQHVDIEGAGELKTLITSSVSSISCNPGTVVAAGNAEGASNAELRFLTVRNTATGLCGVGKETDTSSVEQTRCCGSGSSGPGLGELLRV